MSKRCNDGCLSILVPSKRARADITSDRLSSLSDEILLHILSFLPIPSLLLCQRLSRRFRDLTGDSELWKRQYYARWVRPRVRRLANARNATFPHSKVEYSPKVSTWLDHGHLAKKGSLTNWKRQYRLRHNWSKGLCRVTELELPQPPRLPMLMDFCGGLILTADPDSGLRAWLASNPSSCLASEAFPQHAIPTALAAASDSQQNSVHVAVGFENGHFNMYMIHGTQLSLCLAHHGSGDEPVTAMALSHPYLLMVSQHKLLSLFEVSIGNVHSLVSLKADSILAPMSLSVRNAGSEIISSIVYSFFHIGCGWSLGIQELRFNQCGRQIASQLATTVDSQYGVEHHFTGSGRTNFDPAISHHEPPTSVSYSHPYLLTSHADNTLTVYLLVSTATGLAVKGGKRLFGHTSKVSAVQVSDRGKAISVSSHGDEIRIWELEALMPSIGSRKEGKSIQVSPGNKKRAVSGGRGLLSGIYYDVDETQPDLAIPSISFDEECVLLLREKNIGTQILEFYDFT